MHAIETLEREINMRKLLLRLLPILLGFSTAWPAEPYTGSIHGLVIDGGTRQPLPGANVALVDSRLGTIAGGDGHFAIEDVPVGTHRLRVSLVGYVERIRPDVVVRSNRISTVEVGLEEGVVGMAETVIEAGYFSEETSSRVSAVNFNYEEIRRSPGSAQDISRLLQALPSVNMNNDQRNDLIVRGGSPSEILTLVDNVRIGNINHFPTQGASGGPIGLLNAELIEDVTFNAGGFGAEYGDRMSAVMSIQLREGNREEFDGEYNMSMAGAGFILEGPLSNGRGSWIASARRSYLDLIVGAIGTGVVPVYSDMQGKLSFDISDKHQLALLGISGFDNIELGPDDADDAADGEDFFSQDVTQFVVGANWRWLWSTRGYSETSLAISASDFSLTSDDNPTEVRQFSNESQELDLALRSRTFTRLRPGTSLEWGVDVKRISSEFEIFVTRDTNRVNVEIPEQQIGDEVRSTKTGRLSEPRACVDPALEGNRGRALRLLRFQ